MQDKHINAREAYIPALSWNMEQGNIQNETPRKGTENKYMF